MLIFSEVVSDTINGFLKINRIQVSLRVSIRSMVGLDYKTTHSYPRQYLKVRGHIQEMENRVHDTHFVES